MKWSVACSFAVVSILSSGPAANAGDGVDVPDPARLTLEEALERAIEVAPGLRALDADVAAADAETRVTRADRRPQVDLSAGYARWSNIPVFSIIDPTGTEQVIYPNIPDNWTTLLGVSYPLYAGGGPASVERAAESESAAAREDFRTGKADLVLEVTRAYWALVTARADRRVLVESMRSYDAHLADARNRERIGLAARNEVLAVRVDRDRAELGKIRAVNSEARAQADLARLLDFPVGTPIDPVESVEPDAPVPRDADALVEEAFSTRPESASMRQRIAAAEARIGAERSARRPSVTLAANYEYANPNRRIIPPTADWKGTWDVGVAVSFRAYDGGRAAASVARAQSRAEALRERLDGLERRIRLEVTSALLDIDSAWAAVPVAERSVESALEDVRVTRERYREGVTPSSDLLDAEARLLRVQLDRTRALVAVRLARADLDRAVGRSTWNTP
jgi:outer membrane protein TolC